MNSLLKADIFFFTATIAMVILTVVLIVAVVYIIRILRDIKKVSSTVKNESGEIVGDIKNLREKVKKDGIDLKKVGKFFGFSKNKKRK